MITGTLSGWKKGEINREGKGLLVLLIHRQSGFQTAIKKVPIQKKKRENVWRKLPRGFKLYQ